jgi:S1-C subfamily serine protease
MARDVMDQLAKNGKVRRGQLGIVVQPVTGEIATSMGLKNARGVIVSEVQPGSAAERAGIKQGEVITSLNGTAVNEPNVLRNEIARTAPGATVMLAVERNGREEQVKATLGEFTQQAENQNPQGDQGTTGRQTGKLGFSVTPLTPDVATQLGVNRNTQGVVVAQVDPSGPAADAGIQPQDIIEQVNQQPVHSAADVRAALARTRTRPALLLVNHRGTTLFVTVTPNA